jgi:putative redox protein
MANQPAIVELSWVGELVFTASFESRSDVISTAASTPLYVDSAGLKGPSPVQTLALALAGCMSVDLVHIIQRGRHRLDQLSTRLVAERANHVPRNLVAVSLHFAIIGDVADAVVARAIRLSRDKYCSVWHSMRPDIDLRVTFHVDRDTL